MDATPPTPATVPLVLRRIAIGLAGLAVAVLAGAACVLSFDDLRALAVIGQAPPRLAYLYPAGFDALLVVALISVPLLRGGRPLVRLQAGLVLTLLLAAAGAATVATALDATFDPREAAVAVALLPWVMLVVGLWMLLVLVKHAQARRADLGDEEDDEEELVPFHREESLAPPLPVEAPAAAEPAAAPMPEEDVLPVVPPTPAPETPPVTELPPPQQPGTAEPLPGTAERLTERPARPVRPRFSRAVRWEERAPVGDVLVHPRPPVPEASPADEEPGETTEPTPVITDEPHDVAAEPPTAESTAAESTAAESLDDGDESDVDTQPIRQLTESPDPAHDAANADPEEFTAAAAAGEATATGQATAASLVDEEDAAIRRQPYPTEAEEEAGTVPMAPPSGRMRSMPRPPE